MKITFSNLGTIRKTALDLRPLTVIIGPNNSSKTYVAYSIYGLWQAQTDGASETYLSEIAQRKHSSTAFAFSIDDTFVQKFNKQLQSAARTFREEMTGFFQDSSSKLFTDARISVRVGQEEIISAIKIAARRNDLLKATIQGSEVRIGIPPSIGKNAPEAAQFRRTATDSLIEDTIAVLFRTPILLPAERNAFIITYKMLANRRYNVLKNAQRSLFTKRRVTKRQLDLLREQGDVRYPKPIEDFLEFLTDVELSEEVSVRSRQGLPFRLLADDMEKHIQNKNKTILGPTALGGREIKIDIDGLSIDLYNASSSIKQLAPFLLYLRYRARRNDFLIIDEPEMNLHPESQAKLLEALGILVNLGVRVLLTTHSPYFMSHLNNLVAGDTTRPEILEQQASSLYLKDHRAFLSMDQVGAYEMRNNELCSLKDEDYGIRWDTLSDVSSEIQARFFEIHEKGRAGRGSDK